MPFDGTEYTSSDPILKVIDRVAELICDEEHWWQAPGPVRVVDGRQASHCPVTAIAACGFNVVGDAPEIDYIWRALQDITGGKHSSIPDYNNAPARTFPEIKALIAKARELRLADIMETADE